MRGVVNELDPPISTDDTDYELKRRVEFYALQVN